jgi:hypothetical protein
MPEKVLVATLDSYNFSVCLVLVYIYLQYMYLAVIYKNQTINKNLKNYKETGFFFLNSLITNVSLFHEYNFLILQVSNVHFPCIDKDLAF